MMKQIAVVCSEFNKNLVEELYKVALMELQASSSFNNKKTQHDPSNPIHVKPLWVPGAGEIPQAIQWILSQRGLNQDFAKEKSSIVGVLALGVVIRGQTAHFDFLQNFLQTALWDLQKTFSVPIVFSVLMLENRNQFKDRVIRANESMQALLKMLKLKEQLCQ